MEMEQETTKRPTVKDVTIVKLDDPIEWGDETISEIKLKKPRGKHIKNLGDDIKVGDMLKIASKVSGVSMGVFDELSSSDCMKVAEAVGELL
jgi:hypothetical protein